MAAFQDRFGFVTIYILDIIMKYSHGSTEDSGIVVTSDSYVST